jgi:hypothetical protein
MTLKLRLFQNSPLTIFGWNILNAEVGPDIGSNKLLFSWRGGDIE